MHHATVLYGTSDSIDSLVPEDDRVTGPDTYIYIYDRLGIADVREVRERADRRPFVRDHVTFVLAFRDATVEAQNALLKILEEPATTTRFYIIVPRRDVLIATVHSRLAEGESHSGVTQNTEAITFAAQSYGERLEEIASHTKAKDTAWTAALLDGLEALAEKTHDRTLIEELMFVRRFSGRPGASEKMLLEHLAISLPFPKNPA